MSKHVSLQLRHAFAAAAVALVFAAPVAAQPSAAAPRAGLMGDLLKDAGEVQTKMVGLAKAMPADKQGWRPAAGVRSVGEVFLHVAADNYLLPGVVGVAPDPSTGISMTDFKTLDTFEKQQLSPDAMVAAMEKSFAHLTKAMAGTPDSRLDERVKFFGQDMSVRQVWVLTMMHLHEHLGQAIAYARTNGVVPPWSRKGG